MSVMVQYIVKVSDVDRFVATSEKFAPMMEEMGGRNGGVYEDENDPRLVSTISEWESHDQMHEASEKYGDQFNEEGRDGRPAAALGRLSPDRAASGRLASPHRGRVLGSERLLPSLPREGTGNDGKRREAERRKLTAQRTRSPLTCTLRPNS
jgi:hypothetical protein